MIGNLFLRLFEHLLPRSRAWTLKPFRVGNQIREFFEGLTGLLSDVRTFFDARWADVDPQQTTQLDLWEEQWGLPNTNLTEQERRDRLEAAWSALGGQSPRYLQDTLQANGFDVYIHEAFEVGPVVPPVAPIIRNPLLYIGDGADFIVLCGEAIAQCGEVEAQAGNSSNPSGFLLVNILEESVTLYLGAGDPEMEAFEPAAQAGNFLGLVQIPKSYDVPTDPAEWPFVLYYGGASFPDPASVAASRKDEFETLVLKISPGQQWLGMLVNYT